MIPRNTPKAKVSIDKEALHAAMLRMPLAMRHLFTRTVDRYRYNNPKATTIPYNVIVDLLLAGWRLTQEPKSERVRQDLPSETGDHD